MPRPRKGTPEPPNSLVASAAQITSRRKTGVPTSTSTGWQAEAWRMLDTVGELEFYREWISNALSRVELYVEETTADGAVRVTEGLSQQALNALFGGETGQSQMMAAFGSLLSIPGEGWLVGLLKPPTDPDGPDVWRVLDKDEVTRQGSRVVINRGDGVDETYEDGSNPDRDAEVLLIRVWRPHPQKWVEAHSSVRSALPILRELEGLTKHVAATIDSRLAGAGILFVPSEMTFTSPLNGEPSDDPEVDPFMATITEAMMAAIRDRSDASAVAPIVAKVPGMYVDKIKLVTFWSEFSAQALELRREAITRLANSLDVPAEVLTGMAQVNHWTGWLLDENAIKMHIEPLVEVVAHAITTKFLWPILQGNDATLNPDLRRYRVIGDTAALRQRPNHSAEAQALHGDMVITDEALIREVGFDEADLLVPGSDEYKRRLLQKVASGVTTADLTAAAMSALGVTLAPKPSEVAPDELAAPATEGAQALPAGPADTPDPRTIPEQGTAPAPLAASGALGTDPTQAMLALYVGAEQAVERAVERAHNRAGKRGKGVRRAIKPDQLEACLTGAWEGRLPRLAELCGVDAVRLHAALDRYTRGLLSTGAAHNEKIFARVLQEQVWSPDEEQRSA